MIDPCFFGPVDDANKVATWEVTKRCELKCPHCCSNSGHNFIEDKYKDIDEIGALKTLDLIHKNGFNMIYFTGGEPLLWAPLVSVIEKAIEKKIECNIATSGFSQPQMVLNNLFKLKVSAFYVSLDSYCAEKHDAFRGIEYAFQRALSFIKLCKDNGFKVVISSMVSDDLVRHANEIIDLLSSCQIDRVVFNYTIPLGRATNSWNKIFTMEERFKTAQILIDAARVKNLNISIKRFEHTRDILQKCPAGSNLILFDAYGKISPCSWIGKLWNDFIITPEECLFDEKTLKILNDRINSLSDKKCSSCMDNIGCGRGCPIVAFFEEEQYDKLCGY